MTLKEATERVLLLLDEDAGSAFAARCRARIPMLLNTAQHEAALIAPIVKKRTEAAVDGTITLASDVCRVCEITRNGKGVPFKWLGSIVEVGFSGPCELTFWAYPEVIDKFTPPNHRLEVCAEAAEALIYYAAALCLLPDEPDRYAVLMSLYTARMQGLCAMPKITVRGRSYV